MSLSRTFGSRSRRSNNSADEISHMPNLLTKASLRTFDRSKIGAPVLLSTTNVDSINAPGVEVAQKLRKVSSISSSSSRNSDKDSDTSSISPRSRGASITDNSSVGSSPSSPKQNDGHSYLNSVKTPSSGPRRAASSADIKRRAATFEQFAPSDQSAPSIPARAPSHGRIAHDQLGRKRSLQTLHTWQQPARSVPTSSPAPQPQSRETRTSQDSFSNQRQRQPEQKSSHPFGKELEQLDEIAEEFGGAVRDAERDAEVTLMRQRRLAKFDAADYLRDLEPIFIHFFRPKPLVIRHAAPVAAPVAAGWI